MSPSARRGHTSQFLIVAAVSAAPTGACFRLTPDDFTSALRDALAGAVVRLDSTRGAGVPRTVVIGAQSLSDLSVAGVIRADETLRRLSEFAESPPDRALSTWLDKLRNITGSGELLEACAEALRDEMAPRSASAPGSPANGSLVDAIFDGATVQSQGSRAVDAFVGAIRKTASSEHVAPSSATAEVQRLVQDAVFASACEVLDDPALSRLEAAWRGLRWVSEACPPRSGLRLEIMDARAEDALRLLGARCEDDEFDGPDLIAFVDPVSDLAELGAIARFADRRLVPCLACEPCSEGPDARLESLAASGSARDAREALRVDEAARWLSVAYGQVVLREERVGARTRTAFGSPVWAVLRALAESYEKTSSFARIVGERGRVRAPGVHQATIRGTDCAIPTRHFVSARAQSELASEGLVALGSPRNSDQVILSGAPTFSNAKDAVPLPAQIWTGRVVRFAKWAQLQIPPGASPGEVSTLFQRAAEVFLYPGIDGARVTASVTDPSIQIRAVFDPSVSLVPMELSFSLPFA